ncbi:MAG: hypothetical protein QOE74_369 [Mycobacterium sp.]|nr:hypothetical protein [Mycobacterium sp.]
MLRRLGGGCDPPQRWTVPQMLEEDVVQRRCHGDGWGAPIALRLIVFRRAGNRNRHQEGIPAACGAFDDEHPRR